MIKKILLTAVLLVTLSMSAYADFGDMGILTSLTTFGAGGLRVDLGSGFVADGALAYVDDGTGTETNELNYWADLYYGAWGVLVMGGQNTDPSFSFMYAMEQSLSEDVVLGIATDIATISSGVAPQFFSTWDAYLVLAL